MAIPIKKSNYLGFVKEKLQNYVSDLDKDLSQLYSQFRTLISFNKIQAMSYLSQDGSSGTTTNIALAKLTALGTDGSLTIKNGLITNFVDPT